MRRSRHWRHEDASPDFDHVETTTVPEGASRGDIEAIVVEVDDSFTVALRLNDHPKSGHADRHGLTPSCRLAPRLEANRASW